jgi:hypothetical protein
MLRDIIGIITEDVRERETENEIVSPQRVTNGIIFVINHTQIVIRNYMSLLFH